MSNVKLQASASGTGTVTIAPPVTNSDLTINLPANSGTVPTIASVVNNGVVYTNSTGAITSSSALTFDGTNLGVGTSTPGERLTVAATANNAGRFTSTATTTALVLDNTNANGWGSNIAINTGGVAAGYFGTIGSLLGSTAQDLAVYANTGNGFRVYTNGNNERLTLDSSGNLGLGVTPSAWESGQRAFDFGITGTLKSNTATGSVVSLGNNCYYGSSFWRYKQSSQAAALYDLRDTGEHRWYNAPSGTAGNAITFTQAMTLDASGRLGIATTSPDRPVHLGGSGNRNYFKAETTTNSNSNESGFEVKTPSANFLIGSLGATNALYFYDANAATERARITSGGDLLVGTTTSNGKLAVVGSASSTGYNLFLSQGTSYQDVGGYGDASSGNGTWNWQPGTVPGSGVAEFFTRFRSRASGGTTNHNVIVDGNLLVGTTSSAQNANTGIKNIASGAVYVVNSGGTDGFSYYNTTAGAYRFYVQNNGTIAATNTTIAAISDQRLKENVRDLDVGLNAIMALKPRKFDWKAGKGKDIKDDRGFIAQEFEQVFPDLIDEWKDPAPEGEEPYKAVRADLIPVLVKAIQELKAEFDAYKATHP